MPKCVVCLKVCKKNTCSKSCAGTLSSSKRYYKKLETRYKSCGKTDDLNKLTNFLSKLKDPYLFELHGGGNFFRKACILKNNCHIMSIDYDQRLFPVIRELNKKHFPHNWLLTTNVKDIINKQDANGNYFFSFFDFIYLDYCGWWNESKFDEVKEIAHQCKGDKPRYIAITITRAREHYKGSSDVLSRTFDASFSAQINTLLPRPLQSNPIYKNLYISGKYPMYTFLFEYNT